MMLRPSGFLALLLALLVATSCTEDPSSPGAESVRPTPRWPDGRVRLDRVPGELGYWGAASASGLVEQGAAVEMDERGLLLDISQAGSVAPFQPWTQALYEYRQANGLKDDPMVRCAPPGGPRQFHTPGGFRIIQERDTERIFIVFGGANRNWRLINLDGRSPPNLDEVTGRFFGYSTGHWEDDTLVVESVGFNVAFWFSNGGLPHTEALRLTERFSRPDFNTLRYAVTIDDPWAYTRPWSSEWTIQWVADAEIEEYFCEDTR